MKKFLNFALAFVVMIAVTPAATPPDPSEISTRENAIWRSVQQKKVDQFKQLVSANVMAVYADGIMTMPDELKAIPRRTPMKSISLSDFKVTFSNPQTAIVAYVAKVETVADGKKVFTTYNAGSVWQLSKGQWQAIFHGEAKQVPAKPAPPESSPLAAPKPPRSN